MPMAKMKFKSTTKYPTDLIFAASAAADRVNQGEYIKPGYSSYEIADADNLPQPQSKLPNKQLMVDFLLDQRKITAEDHERGNEIRTHYKALTFEILKGKKLNDFQTKVLSLVDLDEISERDIATIACLPFLFAKDQARRNVDSRFRECKSEYVGVVGTKVIVSMEILKASYSTTYSCYFISGITKDNFSVFFATSNWGPNMVVGNTITVSGKVKAHRDDWVSQLNYTKIQ